MTALLLLIACGPAAEDTAERPTDDTAQAGPPDAWTDHYAVESVIEASGHTFEEAYWARRTVDPTASTIEEEFVATADGTVFLTSLVVDPAAATFTLDINDGEYTGEGTLHGEPWAWTAWESHSTTSDGSYVESEDTVTATGLEAHKVGYSAAGDQQWTLVEVLTAVTEAEWQAGVDAVGR